VFNDLGFEGIDCALRQFLIFTVIEDASESVKVGCGDTVGAWFGIVEPIF
jgi:hypothetical protein